MAGWTPGQTPSPVSDPRVQDLAQARAWTTILMVRGRMVGPPTSIVDSPDYFLAPKSQDWTPAGELAATLAAFAAPQTTDPAALDADPMCRFPAREAYLRRVAPDLAAAWPPRTCPRLGAFLAEIGEEGASLVFSSSFANNPASLFGHTFLRLKRPKVPGRVDSALLDDTVNFMAYPDSNNAVVYAYRGLAGGFPGHFAILPLYLKVQEYNNSESRDLWEYELSLTKPQLALMKRALWELGPTVIDYYYFDENCALVLLMLMELANPALELPLPHLWMIPSDAMRVALRAPGLVTKVTYRASVLTRFLARYRRLDDSERALVDGILGANDAAAAKKSLLALAVAPRAAVIDTVIEYVDYDEQLAGTKAATVHAALRQTLLLLRATTRAPRLAPDPPPPAAERPDRGGGTSRVGTGAVSAPGQAGTLQLSWRPALRALDEPDWGAAPGLAITFFDTVLRWRPATRQLFGERFDLLTIQSVPRLPWLARPFAWSLEIGAANAGDGAGASWHCLDKRVRAGVGPVFGVGPLALYGLATAEAGAAAATGLPWFAGVAAGAGMTLPFSPFAKLSAYGEAGRRFGPAGAVLDRRVGRVEAAVLAAEAWELAFAWERKPWASEASAALYHFY